MVVGKKAGCPVWDLPGGTLENGESDFECAIREAKEETGLEIVIIRKIGCYYRPLYQDIQHILVGRGVGGQQILNGPKTANMEWFTFNKLPLFIVPNRKAQILDYVRKKEPGDVGINDSKIIYFFRQLINKK
ncbi:NUDIX hydrolase [Paenibacillus mesotrionivorans]|uniref:NUDIX hydrolase n=1 Tax=Paenibacillus mesotrionivorans TaxID=3160968 RepID=A0ACC7P136_9BACL